MANAGKSSPRLPNSEKVTKKKIGGIKISTKIGRKKGGTIVTKIGKIGGKLTDKCGNSL